MSAADATKVIDEEVPTLETAEEVIPTLDGRSGKQSKRYAKAMSKLGLVAENNILRVSVKKFGSISFGFTNPEVYRFPGTNTFVFFGEFQVEELGMDNQKQAARSVAKPAEKKAAAPAVDEKPEDATGIPDKEIEMVMSQANVTRNQAIKALKNNNGDLVNAIMELTM
eukprot:GILI01000952.1.p4 GENE.GILI01000952.1~~GILI01000952.1.p4  ORF type:complete len:168 (+),score=98.07 GILI01000952.1:2239-2742(+)